MALCNEYDSNHVLHLNIKYIQQSSLQILYIDVKYMLYPRHCSRQKNYFSHVNNSSIVYIVRSDVLLCLYAIIQIDRYRYIHRINVTYIEPTFSKLVSKLCRNLFTPIMKHCHHFYCNE